MPNSNKTEAQDFQDRKDAFHTTFKNASEILSKSKESKNFSTFPKNERSTELRKQFFMAIALHESHAHKSKLYDKIEPLLDETQKRKFTFSFMSNEYTYEHLLHSLEKNAL